MPNGGNRESAVKLTVTGDGLDEAIDELDEMTDVSRVADTSSEGEIPDLTWRKDAFGSAVEAVIEGPGQSATFLKHWVLVVVVNDVNTTAAPLTPEGIQRYIKLLENTYGVGNVDVKGADAYDGKDNPLTQEEFIGTLEEKKTEMLFTRDAQGRQYYSQIHLIGHGFPDIGIQFKDWVGFDRKKEDDAGRTAKGISPLIKRAGKVVIAACYAADGQLPPWLAETLGEDSVYAVKGLFFIPWIRNKSTPKGWHSHPSLRGIADFLGIDYKSKVKIKPTGPKPIDEDRSQSVEALTLQEAHYRKIRPRRPLRTR